MNSFTDVIKNLDWSVPLDMLMSIIPALICITLHELSHGFVAYKLGDPTAKNRGRLTLNPIKHIDLVGLIMMVAFKFGWAKPVPVDMRYFRNPKRGMAITAIAGPLSNVIIACFFLFLYGFVYIPLTIKNTEFCGAVLDTVYITAYLSLALAVFNCIPIPPLDGSKVLFSLMSDRAYWKLMRYERYGMILLIVVLATGIIGDPLSDATKFVFNKLTFFAEWGFGLAKLIFI